MLTVLSATPKQIARIARGCSDRKLHRKPEADAWSAQEIVAHLRACAEVWGRSIDRMLAEDHPQIRYVSPRGWIKKTDFLEQRFRDSLRAFTRQRAILVGVLGYARRIADHEVRHLDRLRRTVGT